MVRQGDELRKRIELLTEKSSPEHLRFVFRDFHDRYSGEDINRICSGENWDNVEAALATTIAMAMETLGPIGTIVAPLITSLMHGVIVFAFLLGYEKARSEALSRELGLGGRQ